MLAALVTSSAVEGEMEEREMPERSKVLPLWVWIIGALLVVGLIFVGVQTVQTQHHLRAIKAQIATAKDEAAQAMMQAAARNKRADDLNSALEASNTQRNEIQTKLDQATSEIDQLKAKLSAAQSEAQEAKADAAKANDQSNAIQSRLDQINSVMERLKSELEQAKETPSPAGAPSTEGPEPVPAPTSPSMPKE